MRVALTALALLGFLLVAAPAVLVDGLLRHASEGRLRLAEPAGTVWRGEGRLALASEGDAAMPWARLSWRFVVGGLSEAGWHLELDGQPAARALLRPNGLAFEGLALDLPIGPLAEAVPHPLARSGWSGRLRVQGQGLACGWGGQCGGGGELSFDGVRSAILPGAALGDYRVVLAAAAQGVAVRVASDVDNRLRVDGRSERDASGRFSAAFDLAGDAELMRVLPGLLHGVAQTRPDGSLRIEWAGR